jgi:hypothetical protein
MAFATVHEIAGDGDFMVDLAAFETLPKMIGLSSAGRNPSRRQNLSGHRAPTFRSWITGRALLPSAESFGLHYGVEF